MIFILLEGMLRLSLHAHSSIKKHQSMLQKKRTASFTYRHAAHDSTLQQIQLTFITEVC